MSVNNLTRKISRIIDELLHNTLGKEFGSFSKHLATKRSQIFNQIRPAKMIVKIKIKLYFQM